MMDLQAKPLRIFVRVAELRSFSRAAEALNMSQPALSAQIRELERQLAFPLFRRNSRKVELTQQGAMFLDNARRMIVEVDWLLQAAREIRSNGLRIGVAHHTSTIETRTRLTDSFLVARKDVPVTIWPRHPRQLVQDLADGSVDLAIMLEIVQAPHRPLVERSPDQEDRCIVARRPIQIAVPVEHEWASSDLHGGMLAGASIATISRAHGVAVSEAIAHTLSNLDSVLVHPPEGDGASVLRFGNLMRLPAIDLGWYCARPGLVSKTIEWDLATALAVFPAPSSTNPATGIFLDHAREFASS